MEKGINKKLIERMVKEAAFRVAKITANTACVFVLYQEELPEKVKELRKL